MNKIQRLDLRGGFRAACGHCDADVVTDWNQIAA